MAHIEIEKTPNHSFYPRIHGSQTITTDQVIHDLTQKTTLTSSDIRAVLSGLSDVLVKHLQEGNRVRFDELGEFYVSLTLKDPLVYEKEKEIHAAQVKFKQICFRADRKLSTQLSELQLCREKGYSRKKSRLSLEDRRKLLSVLFARDSFTTLPLYSRHTQVSIYQARKDMEIFRREGIVRVERRNNAHYYYPVSGNSEYGKGL